MMLMRTHKTKGFSLIELMIAVAIIGIIAAIALPSYKNSIRKSKRQTAISDIMLYRQAEERYRTNNLTYGTLAQISVAPYSFTVSSKSSDYIFTIDGGAGITNPTTTDYRVVATPQGTQALGSEASCNPLTLTSPDVRGPSDDCWAR